MAKMVQETGQQVVGFTKHPCLIPCFNGHEEEKAQSKKSIME